MTAPTLDVEPGLEFVRHGDRLIAIVVRHDLRGEGIRFLTPSDASQQLAIMFRPGGYQVRPHVHNLVERSVTYTQEVLLVRRGRIRVSLYSDSREPLGQRVLEAGDVILLAGGGHGVDFLEDSEVVEVKQGPYLGDRDKVIFE